MNESSRNYFFWNESLYERAVKKHVCHRCPDYIPNGVCAIPDPAGCAIFRYLPQLVLMAQHLKEPNVESYIETVRREAGLRCANTEPGPCRLRDTVDCGMDRYLPLIIEAVEEVSNEMEKGTGEV